MGAEAEQDRNKAEAEATKSRQDIKSLATVSAVEADIESPPEPVVIGESPVVVDEDYALIAAMESQQRAIHEVQLPEPDIESPPEPVTEVKSVAESATPKPETIVPLSTQEETILIAPSESGGLEDTAPALEAEAPDPAPETFDAVTIQDQSETIVPPIAPELAAATEEAAQSPTDVIDDAQPVGQALLPPEPETLLALEPIDIVEDTDDDPVSSELLLIAQEDLSLPPTEIEGKSFISDTAPESADYIEPYDTTATEEDQQDNMIIGYLEQHIKTGEPTEPEEIIPVLNTIEKSVEEAAQVLADSTEVDDDTTYEVVNAAQDDVEKLIVKLFEGFNLHYQEEEPRRLATQIIEERTRELKTGPIKEQAIDKGTNERKVSFVSRLAQYIKQKFDISGMMGSIAIKSFAMQLN